LREGITSAGVACEALPDGMTVKIDEHTAYEPDALVHCESTLPDDAIIVPAPVIVVEVLSPLTKGHDAGAKLAGYFRLPSVRHYLLVRIERPTVIHHRRADDGSIATRVVTAGALELDPPGLALELTQIYG
jgi:Uma2 family endonuclease